MLDFFKNKSLWFWLAILLLLALLLYFYTYFFSKNNPKVIYQDAQRRIYLTRKGPYKGQKGADREMWRMVYEDLKTGQRWFVIANTKKGTSEKKVVKRILNTVEQGKTRTFDNVESIGVSMYDAKTDVHSNITDKKDISDFIDLDEKDFQLI